MKAEVMGYITGMINSYERTINQYKKDELPKEKYKNFDLVKEELSDLLDFVQDIPEVTTTDTFPKINRLNKRVAELEDSCENMNDIEKNLHLQIKELYVENTGGQAAYQELKEENQKLVTETKINERVSKIREKNNEILRLENISWQKKCNELKLKNEYQKESLKIYEANRQAFSLRAAIFKNKEEK